jgi:hypothetical protein
MGAKWVRHGICELAFTVAVSESNIKQREKKVSSEIEDIKQGLLVLILTCILRILEYVENNQQNALNSILIYFSFYNGSYMFRQNNAILREQLYFFLSHFNIIMVGDKS